MHRTQKRAGLLGLTFAASLWAALAGAEQPSAPRPLLKGRIDPKEFGIQDDTITVVHASSFTGPCSGAAFTPYLGEYELDPVCDTHYYATLDIPAGAIIDFIGLNTANDTDAVFGFELWQRDRHGNRTPLTSFSVPAHDWNTDFWGPLTIQVSDHIDRSSCSTSSRLPARITSTSDGSRFTGTAR